MVWCWISYLSQEVFYTCIFASAKHKILTHKWNKIHIQCQKHWIFCLLHFLWSLNMFLSNLTTLHAIHDTSHNRLLFSHYENNTWYFHSVRITPSQDITFMQWINQIFHDWKCNKEVSRISISINNIKLKQN